MSSTHTQPPPLHALSQTRISQIEEDSMHAPTSMPSTIPICSWVLRVPMAAVIGISLLLQIASFPLVILEKDNQQDNSSSGKDVFRENAPQIAVAHTIVTTVAALYCFLLTRTSTCLPNRRSCLLSRIGARSRIRLSYARGALGLVLVLCVILFAIEDSFVIIRSSRGKGGQGVLIVGILLALDVLLAALIALDIGLRLLHRRVLRDQAHQLQEEDVGDRESTAGSSLRTMQRPSEDLPKYERYARHEPTDGDAPVYSA